MSNETIHEADIETGSNPFEVGFTPRRFDPSEERYRHMLHLVAYDVRHPRRLRRVAKVCADYGVRVEYSVFECDLAEDVFQAFWQELEAEIDPDEDTILAYRICGVCVRRIRSMGLTTRPQNALLYMI
ncbi:MAG TPA: CRISPR-associated endonuclease Cas2 [Acidobacteriota bacterium]|nr:CRISPR-associated endonuclease Cas2 [Acidobacteriota bacterium]